MEKICSSETSVNIERTTRRYIPEYSNLSSVGFQDSKMNQSSFSYHPTARELFYRIL
jgi:hypothetical protein